MFVLSLAAELLLLLSLAGVFVFLIISMAVFPGRGLLLPLAQHELHCVPKVEQTAIWHIKLVCYLFQVKEILEITPNVT